jgi:uncharacterized protein YdcH (DUF465 family)
MEISEEMKEAIRILKEDGQMASFNKLTESHQEVIQRLDHIEDNYSEYRATKEKETEPAKQTESGTPSNTPNDVPTNPGGPEPPPVKQEEPEPIKKGRLAWWERGSYAGD